MPATQLLYAGAGDAIAVYHRADDGSLTLQRSVPVPGGVRALCLAPDNYSMHVVTPENQCLTLKVDQASGDLTPSGGDAVPLPIAPAYATTDKTGRFVLLASYMEPGAIAALSVGADGNVKAVASTLSDLRSYSHFIGTDVTNRFAFVPCVAGADSTNGNAIHQLCFDSATGALTHNAPPIIPPPTGPTPSPRFDGPLDVAEEPEGGFPDGFSAKAAPGPYNRFGTRPELGPRHFVFHPYLSNIMYTANEQGNSVSAYRMDGSSGLLTHLQTLPTVPDDFSEVSHCAEIKFSPDGRWLLAPNRALPATGCCSVAVFGVDSAGGLSLSEICLINDVPDSFSPQHIALDTSGQRVYIGDGGTLCQFYLDTNHGKLIRVTEYSCGGKDGSQTGGYLVVDLSGANL